MSWVAAGVAVVGGGIQVAQGIKQQREGRDLENSLNKPEFQIPPEIAKNMSEAEMRAYQGLPDEQKAAFLDNQQRAAQTALRSSSDRRGGLGMISQIQANQDRSSLGLLQQDVAARDANILRAQEARKVMASYRDKRFEHEYNEYSSDLDYARAQVGAGMQNVAGGLVTAGSAVQSGIANQAGGDGLTRAERKLYEQQNTPVPEQPLQDNNPFTGKQKEQYNRFIQGQGEFSEQGRFGDVYANNDMLNLTGTEGEVTPASMTFQEFKNSQYNTNKPWWKK
tara:strand:- start:12756 stop:13595 length:840 start_codon:yes stop_codon:yes gene_type:complete